MAAVNGFLELFKYKAVFLKVFTLDKSSRFWNNQSPLGLLQRTLLNPRFHSIGLQSILGLILDYSWAPSWITLGDLVCGNFAGEILGVTTPKKGEDAC